jgi:Fur family peroxide stress response transcriptional regulator
MENYSKQREEIIEVLDNSFDHPTAEEIYERLKKNMSTSSRSTVYRNLALLVNKKIMQKISIPEGPDRYSLIRDKHCHAICSKCGKVFDFNYNLNFNELKNTIYMQTKVECDLENFTIVGICENCKEKLI